MSTIATKHGSTSRNGRLVMKHVMACVPNDTSHALCSWMNTCMPHHMSYSALLLAPPTPATCCLVPPHAQAAHTAETGSSRHKQQHWQHSSMNGSRASSSDLLKVTAVKYQAACELQYNSWHLHDPTSQTRRHEALRCTPRQHMSRIPAVHRGIEHRKDYTVTARTINCTRL